MSCSGFLPTNVYRCPYLRIKPKLLLTPLEHPRHNSAPGPLHLLFQLLKTLFLNSYLFPGKLLSHLSVLRSAAPSSRKPSLNSKAAWSLLLHGFFSHCSKWGLLSICGTRASHCSGFSSCRSQVLGCRVSVVAPLWLWSTGSVVVVHEPNCSTARGILPDQGSNPVS